MRPLLAAIRAPLPDVQMAGEPALPADHDKVIEPRAPGDADLTGKDATPTENHVVPDLHQIINHRAWADHSIVPGSAIYSGVRADVDIVADHDPAELRDLDRSDRIGREAEPVLADPHSRVQHDARSYQTMAQRHIGADPAIIADLDAGGDDAIGAHPAAMPQSHPGSMTTFGPISQSSGTTASGSMIAEAARLAMALVGG